MKEKGFTLVELIAVLVILSIITLLAIPNIVGLMDEGRKNSFVEEVQEMVSTATYMYKNEQTRDNSGKFSSKNNTKYTIKIADLNGTIPDKDSFGYQYKPYESCISFVEPSDTESTFEGRTVKVFVKSCRGNSCHYICSDNGKNLKTTDIKESCNLGCD